MWQDYVILTGSIVAIASLVPTLLDEDAGIPHTTSVPTLVVLSGQAVAFYTLGLLGAAAGATAGFGLWTLIALFKAPDEQGASGAPPDGSTDVDLDARDRSDPAFQPAD